MRRTVTVLLFAAVAAEPDGGVFAAGLDGVRADVARERWREGKERLARLLEEHAKQPYVFAGRVVIEDLMRRIEFGLRVAPPVPQDVVSGKIVAHDRRAGTIRIVYTRDTMGDWSGDEARRAHPAIFDGPHSIVIRGSRYPKEEGGFVHVCLDGHKQIAVGFGIAARRDAGVLVVPGIYATLQQSGQVTMVEMARPVASPIVGERPFEIEVDVDVTEVRSASAGRRLQRGKKDRQRWGSLSFACLDPDEVEIAGKIDPAWIDGLLDRARKRQVEDFDRAWKPEEHLPAWLVTAPTETTGARTDGRHWPTTLEGASRDAVERAMTLADAGNVVDALKALDKSGEGTDDSVAYLRSILLGRLGRWQESAAAARGVREADPDFTPVLRVEAEALAAIGKRDEAAGLYRGVLARFPGDADLHAEAARFLGTLGRWEEAERIVGDAAARGLTSPRLTRTSLVAHRTRHGPEWPRRHGYESKHYDVQSDIDEKICFEAAQLLEQAHAMFLARLERVPPAEGGRFRVFLFSDEAGYHAHVQDLFGTHVHGSAGLYAPALQQLLIWNPRDKDAMLVTVRHEGFHQYLHRIMPDPPRWFDEGLAEYFEGAKVVRGEWSLGAPRGDHLDVLARGRKPLDEFLYLDADAFWKEAEVNYAEAWAFIHFLLHNTPGHRRIFDRFWDAFRRIPSPDDAIREALADCPMKILDADFGAYIERLRAAR